MELTTIALLIFACMCASFVQRVSGFGFGIFIMTILPFIMPSYGEATTLSGLLAAVQSLIVAIKMKKYISWKRLLPILITFIITSYFAVMFVTSINDQTLKRILGCILIVVSIYFFFISEKVKVKPTLPIQISMGSISGMMGGFFAMQGPPAVLYFLASEKTKEEYIGITQAYFLIGNIMMTIFRAQSGFLTLAVGQAWCYAIVAVFIGTWLGTLVFNRLHIQVLRKVIYAYMAISGVLALVSIAVR